MNDFQTTVRMLRYWHPVVMERGPTVYPVIADYLSDNGECDMAREAERALQVWYEAWWNGRELSADMATWLGRVNERYGPKVMGGRNWLAPMPSRCLIWANEVHVTEQVTPESAPEVFTNPIQRLKVISPWYGSLEMLRNRELMDRVMILDLDFSGALSATEMGMLWIIENMVAPSLVSLNIVPPRTLRWTGPGAVTVGLMNNKHMAKGVRLLWNGRDT
jgi:hypothetical protein